MAAAKDSKAGNSSKESRGKDAKDAATLRRSAHAVYACYYHLMWAPKYRKPIFQGVVKERMEELLREIAQAYEITIDELEVAEDHVHLFCSFPPKLAISRVVTILKSLSARAIFREFPQLRQELWNKEFWSDSFFVRTVGEGITADTIRRYIQHHRGDAPSESGESSSPEEADAQLDLW